jgi:nucleoside-diphosphate-sugar epimerase
VSSDASIPFSSVLVTGASGFIGSRLVQILGEVMSKRDIPFEITGLVRQSQGGTGEASAHLRGKGLTMVPGDLRDPSTFQFGKSMQSGIEVVYHLAAATPESGANRQTLREVNLDGTKNLFGAIQGQVRHFVYVSGVAVFDPGSDTSRIIDEDSPKSRQLEYIKLRLEAEDYLRESCAKSGIDFTVVYFPDIVYGNAGSFRRRFLDSIRKGRFRIPGSGEYHVNFIHLDDAVNILVTIASKRNEASNRSFIASDSTPAPFREFVNFIADELGARHPGSVPLLLAKAAVGSELIKMLTRDIRASNRRISALYSFQYPSYKTGISDVVSQYKSSLQPH